MTLALAGCGGSGGGASTANSGSGQTPAYSAQFREFAVPVSGNVPGDPHPGSWPDDLTVDDQGSIWIAEHHADEVGRLVPSGVGYVYHGYPVPTSHGEMDSIAWDGAHHRVWVSETAGNRLALVDTGGAAPTVSEVSVSTTSYQNPVPGDLALDAVGNLWFTSPYEDGAGTGQAALGRVDGATQQVSYLAAPTAATGMDGITFGQAGALWFVEFGAQRIGRYAQGRFTEFTPPDAQAGPTNIRVDAAGRVWVTEQEANAVAVLDPSVTTGSPWRTIPVPTPASAPTGIAIDGRGNVWFTELAAGKIGLVPAGSSVAVDFAIPTPNSAPEDIQIAPDGRVFFTERYGNKVGEITVSGL